MLIKNASYNLNKYWLKSRYTMVLIYINKYIIFTLFDHG